MLRSFTELLAERAIARRGLGAFTCYDLETARGVLDAAAERAVGVVLLVSAAAFADPGGEQLLAGLVAAAERAPARACIQLDHVGDVELIERAFAAGAGAVMADGSRLPLEGNVELVERATAVARRYGGGVEAELGH